LYFNVICLCLVESAHSNLFCYLSSITMASLCIRIFVLKWQKLKYFCRLLCATLFIHSYASPTCIQPYSLPSSICLWILFISAHYIFSCIPIDLPHWKNPHLQSPSWQFFSSVSLSQTLTGCADFGSLLFSPNPSPDFPPSQIYKDFRGNAVRYQMVTKTFQLVKYSFKIIFKK